MRLKHTISTLIGAFIGALLVTLFIFSPSIVIYLIIKNFKSELTTWTPLSIFMLIVLIVLAIIQILLLIAGLCLIKEIHEKKRQSTSNNIYKFIF